MSRIPLWKIEQAERDALQRLAEVRAVPAYRPPRPFGLSLVKSLRPLLKEAGPASDSLASRWPEIVGQRLAAVTQPIRVGKGKAGGVLHLRTTSAAAPMIQHAAAHILERVNLASGSRIQSIRIVQTTAPVKPAAPRARVLSAAEREELMRRLAQLRTPAVRSALEELGKAVLARNSG